MYYSPFENEDEMAEAYGRLDMRASWTSADGRMIVAGFVNNVLDETGVLQVLRHSQIYSWFFLNVLAFPKINKVGFGAR